MFLGMNFYFSDKALPIFWFYRWDNKGSERDLTCFRSRVWFKLRFRDRNPRAISLPCPCCVSKINEMAGHREGEMIAPHFLSLFHVVLVRTLRSRLCYYPLNKMANQRLSMGQGVTAHKLTSNHVSILYPRTIRRHRLSGATTEVDDWQVDSSQNSVRVSQWCLGVQWVPNAEERQHFCLVPHAEERLSILPEWLWSCVSLLCPHSSTSEQQTTLTARGPSPVLPLCAGSMNVVFACTGTFIWEVAQVSEETLHLYFEPVGELLKTMRTAEVGLSAFCPWGVHEPMEIGVEDYGLKVIGFGCQVEIKKLLTCMSLLTP